MDNNDQLNKKFKFQMFLCLKNVDWFVELIVKYMLNF